jgi:hypothetical protein
MSIMQGAYTLIFGGPARRKPGQWQATLLAAQYMQWIRFADLVPANNWLGIETDSLRHIDESTFEQIDQYCQNDTNNHH